MKITLFLLLLLSAAVGANAQPPEAEILPAAVAETYLAKDNGKGVAGDSAVEFLTTDIPIYCVVTLDSPATATVKMSIVAVSVARVRPETMVISTSYTTSDGQDRVNFTGRPERRWAAGKYRADIYLDGKLARKLDFEIKEPTRALREGKLTGSKVTVKPKQSESNRR